MLRWPTVARQFRTFLPFLFGKPQPTQKMDIGGAEYPLEVLKILQEVSESHFIAFDLEFSGVAGRRKGGTGKLTLQDYYEDIKIAAEKYQILQVGFTIVKEDLKKGRYVARPYNVNISPLTSLRERHFGRVWSYHSGAISFLQRNGFQFEQPIMSGVQYLSRHEEREARQNITEEEEARAKLADMDLKPEDDALVQYIRTSVRKWQAQPKEEQEEYLNIPAEEPEPGVPQHLSRYQVRLTHQTVRNEYPNLKTTGHGHFVQITNPTEQQQASQKLALVEQREKDIAKAVGFRWLIEGIVGGNILDMPDEYIIGGLPTIRSEGKSPKEYLQNLQQKLKARPRVMVGHNCFTDFVNFYKCFIGPLPDTVEEFSSNVHDLLPGVIDTKNLASFGHKRFGNTSLEDVEKDLRTQERPRIQIPAEYDRYENVSRYHEAGYDSLMTAKIAIKYSAKLEREQEYLNNMAMAASTTNETFGTESDEFHEAGATPDAMPQTLSIPEKMLLPVKALSGGTGVLQKQSNQADIGYIASNGVPPDAVSLEEVIAVKNLPPPKWSEKAEIDAIKKSLESTNIYDVLEDAEGMTSSFESGTSVVETTIDIPSMQRKGEIMPTWDSKVFWSLFGNKLQVNGSKEGVCKLE